MRQDAAWTQNRLDSSNRSADAEQPAQPCSVEYAYRAEGAAVNRPTNRYTPTEEERNALIDAGWHDDADGWWYPPELGLARTYREAEAEQKRRDRSVSVEPDGGKSYA